MVNSGSSANLVATAALAHQYGGWRRDDRLRDGFIVPAIAWATTYAPSIQYGLQPTVVDVDDTWNAPVDRVLEMRWNCPPRLVVAVPILGNPAYLSEWQDLALRLEIPLLEDCCESLGACARGTGVVHQKLAGSFGTISTLSFFYSHQLSAWEGGAALTDDDDLAKTMRLLRNHGNAGWGSDDFDASYEFHMFGYNLRPSELNAAVAREQMKKLPDFIYFRQTNATVFRELTAGLPIQHPRIEGEPSPFGLPFTVESKETRSRLVEALRAKSIDARLPTGGSFTRHPYGAPWRDQPTPNADRIHDTGLFLGNAPYLIPDLIERAVRVMREVL
jgi:CDP-6-deoxy-D-xylo-4-hexulose-3-dehydrase